jgi:hypothetical protein
VGGAAGGLLGALFAVPIAAAIEVAIEGLQSREVPVAQDPTPGSDEADEDQSDVPDAGTADHGSETRPQLPAASSR